LYVFALLKLNIGIWLIVQQIWHGLFCYSPAEACADSPKPPDLMLPEADRDEKLGLEISEELAGP